MRNVIFALTFIGIIVVLSTSCEDMMGDFLEKPPGIDVTEDTIFSSKIQAETFLTSIYEYGIHNILPTQDISHPRPYHISCATDQAENNKPFHNIHSFNNGSISPNNTVEHHRFPINYIAIRKVTVFLDRIDDVPGLDQAYIDQVKAEVKFIRALVYFEMFKRWGGVPIIDRRLQLTDTLTIPRSSIEDLVNFIVKDCDEAAKVLPSVYPANLKGRITKGAALTLKARTLLYAASPQFNTATPYLDFGENNHLICYGNYDKGRWQLAADAAKAVIDWAPEGDCALITDQGVDKNYKYVWEELDNKEVILSSKNQDGNNMPWKNLTSKTIAGAGVAISPIFTWVKKYEKANGEPQSWNPEGGNDLQEKMKELEPRFHHTMFYNMSYFNWEKPVIETFKGGQDFIDCVGGFWLRKFIPDAYDSNNKRPVSNPALFRLAEAYLNYAEALNEAQGPVPDAYEAVNVIRNRSGLPDLPEGLSQEEFRDKVHHERNIELAFESHRFFDIRRWMIAENDGVMQGDMYGIEIEKIENSSEFSYKPYVFETRTWLRRMYLHPFTIEEANKGYLIQNPGY